MLKLEQAICLELTRRFAIERATSKMNSLDFDYDMEMDQIFKEMYVMYMIRLLPRVEPSYPHQLQYLHHIWEDVGDFIQRREFFDEFAIDCDDYGLPVDFSTLRMHLN